MKMSEGVEWAAHACALLAALPPDRALTAEALAAFNDLPPAYMAKHLQALRRAGLIASSRGARGGYWLARAPGDITLRAIAEAVDGAAPAFRCTEIRQQGPCPARRAACRAPCSIARAFHAAEKAMRETLEGVTLAMICADVAKGYKPADVARAGAWLNDNMIERPSS
ncbi:MAG: Rrf2 family transcriptional regulator [Parvularculaceae bacterium]